MSLLFPPGIENLADLPHPLHQAILAAFHWLSFEEWPIRDRPPKRIWTDSDKLKAHWRMVERRRKAEMENPDLRRDEDEDEDQEIGDEEPVGGSRWNAVELIKRG